MLMTLKIINRVDVKSLLLEFSFLSIKAGILSALLIVSHIIDQLVCTLFDLLVPLVLSLSLYF